MERIYTYFTFNVTWYLVMRILVIATLRTGGTQLSNWIAKEFDYNCIQEPTRDYIGGDDVVVKHLAMSIIESHTIPYADFDPKRWDKIITLKRKDILKVAESITFAQERNLYHSTYTINSEWVKNNEYNIGENKIFIDRLNSDIDKIDFAGLKLTYEGIYETGEEIPMLIDYLGITNPQHLDMLDKKNKYRKDIL